MGVSRDDDHRQIAARYAEKWGVDPGTTMWEGALYFSQVTGFPSEFFWVYKEFVLDADGKHLEAGGEEVLTVTRRRPIPEEWIEEYEAEVRDLYQN